MLNSELAEKKTLAYSPDVPASERLRYLCQTDYLAFCAWVNPEFKPYKVHRYLTSLLQSVAEGNTRKLALACPPRTGKSLLVSQLLPAWILGRNPQSYNILASYALKLSREHALRTLQTMVSDRYRFVFPEVELKSTEVAETIRLKNGGISRIFSAGANVTGFSFGALEFDVPPGVAILDDLLASGGSQAILESTYRWTVEQFLTRKLPNHAIISMGTRFAENDITGRLIESDPGFTYVNIPALCTDESSDPLKRKLGESHWKEVYDESFLAEVRTQIGENTWQTLYQGNPASLSTNIFPDRLLYFYDKPPEAFQTKFASMDTAFSTKSSADYSVLCIWGIAGGILYLLDTIRKQVDFPDLLTEVKSVAQRWNVNQFIIEDTASGKSLIQVLQRETALRILPVRPTKDKVSRANEIVATLEKGLVKLPQSLHRDLLAELKNFPYDSHDDFVDSFVYGVKHFQDTYRESQGLTQGIKLLRRKVL